MSHPANNQYKSSDQVDVISTAPLGCALRRSCDRCHVQKLKCSRSNGSPAQCLRCEQAGLRCVYSARSVRRTPRKGNTSADLASHPHTQNAQQTKLTLGDGIFDTSSLRSYDVSQDELASMQDWPSWGQGADSSLTELLELDAATSSCQVESLYSTPPSEGVKESEQHKLFESLTSISQALEGILHGMVTVWPGQDIQRCTHPTGLLKSFCMQADIAHDRPDRRSF